MENKTVYEQYKDAMLKYYKKMMSSGYKGDSAFSPTLVKDTNELLIKIPLSYPSMEAKRSHTNGNGVTLRYDSTSKSLLMQLGNFDTTIDDETGLEHVAEKLSLIYHPDGTMDVTHISENNLLLTEKDEDNIDKRTYSSMLSYGKNIPGISVEQLLNESDVLDQMDTSFFEDLSRRLNFAAPEFDIQTISKDDIEPEF